MAACDERFGGRTVAELVRLNGQEETAEWLEPLIEEADRHVAHGEQKIHLGI